MVDELSRFLRAVPLGLLSLADYLASVPQTAVWGLTVPCLSPDIVRDWPQTVTADHGI